MRDFTLKLNEQQLNVISGLLGDAPTKIGMPLVLEIQRQINEQQKRDAVTDDEK